MKPIRMSAQITSVKGTFLQDVFLCSFCTGASQSCELLQMLALGDWLSLWERCSPSDDYQAFIWLMRGQIWPDCLAQGNIINSAVRLHLPRRMSPGWRHRSKSWCCHPEHRDGLATKPGQAFFTSKLHRQRATLYGNQHKKIKIILYSF